MTSHWYAIADAGGNVYPGTFAATPEDSETLHYTRGRQIPYSIPVEACAPYPIKRDLWNAYVQRGDHVVRCRIETDEQVKVTVEEARWEGEGGRG